MNNFKENIGNIIMCLGEILIGIILIIKPVGFTKTIIIGVGLILLVMGIINVVKYFKTNAIDAMKEQSLSTGLIFSTIGLFCTFRSNWFIATFPVLTILYGIIIFLVGLKKVQWAVDLIRLKRKHWYVAGINAILSIVFALIVMNNPFSTIAVLWQFTGIVLIVESVFDIIAIAFDTKEVKD